MRRLRTLRVKKSSFFTFYATSAFLLFCFGLSIQNSMKRPSITASKLFRRFFILFCGWSMVIHLSLFINFPESRCCATAGGRRNFFYFSLCVLIFFFLEVPTGLKPSLDFFPATCYIRIECARVKTFHESRLTLTPHKTSFSAELFPNFISLCCVGAWRHLQKIQNFFWHKATKVEMIFHLSIYYKLEINFERNPKSIFVTHVDHINFSADPIPFVKLKH